MYTSHPSAELTRLFRQRPFQGADPAGATFLFVGLDANYDAAVERGPVFAALREYHEDGVAFWRRRGVHHPFLLPEYTGDGRLYHRSFARLGFGPEHAHLVSFVELLDLPTTGRSRLTREDFDRAHLERLRAWIFDGAARHIFVTSDVLRLTAPTCVFPWRAPRGALSDGDGLRVVHRAEGKSVYQYLHLSNYGKFQRRKEQEAEAIRALLSSAKRSVRRSHGRRKSLCRKGVVDSGKYLARQASGDAGIARCATAL